MKYYSSYYKGFYDGLLEQHYRDSGSWPEDLVLVSDDRWAEFMGSPPAGKVLGSDKKGMPAWVDAPKLTESKLKEIATLKKQTLIDQANFHMNNKQWPGKAAIGRLIGDELARYNEWLDYLDDLDRVEVTGEDTKWPSAPE